MESWINQTLKARTKYQTSKAELDLSNFLHTHTCVCIFIYMCETQRTFECTYKIDKDRSIQ